MTTEEKARAYDEALAIASRKHKIMVEQKSTLAAGLLEELFPQLRETEDERIRKEIIDFIQWAEDRGMTRHDYHQAKRPAVWIAYLEKQKEQNLIMAKSPQLKEQKPNSTEDMPYITDEHFYEREPADSFKYKLAEYMTRCCTKKEGPYGYEYGISAESILKMAEEELLKRGVVQKPAEWSEEDKTMIERLIRHVQKEFDELCNDRYGHQEIISDLKESCRERMNWLENRLKSLRPSWKPSEEQMKALIDCTIGNEYDVHALVRLWAELKKL